MKTRILDRMRAFARRFATRPVGSALPWTSRLRWTVRRWLGRMGLPGVLAAGVLAVCPAFYLSAVLPAQERLESARHNVLALHRQAELASKAPGGRVHTTAEQLAEFYRMFPDERSTPEWLEKLVSVAESRGVRLNEGEYKASYDKVGRLVRFQMTLPLKAEYPQIRRFLAALPDELPIVALENVQFERRKVADPVVEARVSLVLFLGRES